MLRRSNCRQAATQMGDRSRQFGQHIHLLLMLIGSDGFEIEMLQAAAV